MKSLAQPLSLLVTACIALSACGTESASVARSHLVRETHPNAPDSQLSELVTGNNSFALNLCHQVRTGHGNIMFSPYSISMALAMTYAGAHGATESQMADALDFSLPQELLHPAFNKLDLSLTQEGRAADQAQPLQLNIANAVWAERSLTFRPAYLDVI